METERRFEHPTILTIGHGSRDLASWLAQLQAEGVTWLIDVRTFPTSRWAPHFRKVRLDVPGALPPGMRYLHCPELGGYNRDKTPRTQDAAWQSSIAELARLAREGREVVCIFCMEVDHRTCHRHQTIEPALLTFAPDLHIIHLERPAKHTRQTSLAV